MKTWINGVDGCADALRWFLIWLLNGLPGGNMRSYTTYVVGHYCGRSVFPQAYMTEAAYNRLLAFRESRSVYRVIMTRS